MPQLTLSAFAPGRPAADVDAALRQALAVSEEARRCSVLWFAEIQRRELWRALGHASLELYAVHGLGFSRNRYWQFKRLADELDRLPVLQEAVSDGRVGWTKAQQVARIATPATESDWVERAAQSGRRELAAAVTAEVARVRAKARKVVGDGSANAPASDTIGPQDGTGQLALGLGAPEAVPAAPSRCRRPRAGHRPPLPRLRRRHRHDRRRRAPACAGASRGARLRRDDQ